MSTNTLSPTLFYDLTVPKSGLEPYPATDLIHKLLHHTGADVSSFRRNCQISYRLVEYVRDLYDEINRRIHTAEESGSWEHYDAYNRAIDPLEEMLLNVMEVTEAEREEYLLSAANPELAEQPIANWIKNSISDWHTRRNKIRECLDGFKTQQAFKDFITLPADYEDDVSSAKAHDDRTLLQNLLNSIGENELKVEKGKPQNSQMVKKVKESLQSALEFLKSSPNKALEDDLNVLSIKCAMITYGVTELMKDDKIKQNRALFHRLYSNKIWETAQTLAANIHDHLKSNKDAPNLSGLHKTYAELEAALIGEIPILVPDAYTKLFPLVGRIGRAYHAQSLVLASLCHKVALHFEVNKSHDAHDAFEKALLKATEAFTAAGGLNKNSAVNGTDHVASGALTNGAMSNGTGPSITGDYDQSCENLYDESLSEIQACYKTLKISDESDLQGKLEEARTKDQQRLKLYKSRVSNVVPVRELVDLTLIVYDNDSNGPSINKQHAKVLPTARLSYIKWMAAKEFKETEISHFEDPVQKQPMSLDASIEPLVKDKKCTLHLIVRKGEPKVREI